jgi:hypothetical protein
MKYAFRLLVAGASMLGFMAATAPAAHADCVLVTAQVLWSGGGSSGVDHFCWPPTPWPHWIDYSDHRPALWIVPGYAIEIHIPVP